MCLKCFLEQVHVRSLLYLIWQCIPQFWTFMVNNISAIVFGSVLLTLALACHIVVG